MPIILHYFIDFGYSYFYQTQNFPGSHTALPLGLIKQEAFRLPLL